MTDPRVFGWDYPPGVTGREWQITGEEPDYECLPHAYVFDPEWDGLCEVCGGEERDAVHHVPLD